MRDREAWPTSAAIQTLGQGQVGRRLAEQFLGQGACSQREGSSTARVAPEKSFFSWSPFWDGRNGQDRSLTHCSSVDRGGIHLHPYASQGARATERGHAPVGDA